MALIMSLFLIPILLITAHYYFKWHQYHLSNLPEISPITFLWTLIRFRSVNHSIKYIQQQYKIQSFYVRCLWKRVFILTEANLIGSALSHKNLAQTYIQKNFNLIHGHTDTINEYDSCDSLRHDHHVSAKECLLSASELTQILQKYKYLLWEGYNQTSGGQIQFSISRRLETFICHVWAEFSYGKNVDHEKYQRCRQLILHRLGQDFHSSYWVKVPILGSVYCQLTRMWYRKDYNQIDRDLNDLLVGYDNVCWSTPDLIDLASLIDRSGFMGKYYSILRGNDTFREDRLIGTSFLLILVVDFIHKVFLDYLLRSNLEESTKLKAEEIFNQSLHHGFLYPLRYRWQKADHNLNQFNVIRAGDFLIYDLKASGLYFSSGPHSCVGQTLVKRALFDFFTHEILGNYQLKLTHRGRVAVAGHGFKLINHGVSLDYELESYNVPRLIHEPLAQWAIRKRPITDVVQCLRSYENHMGVSKYINVLNLYANPDIFKYIVENISEKIQSCHPTAIVGVETRGLILAGALAQKLGLPTFVIRKKGSLPGRVYQRSYQKYNSGLGDQMKESVLELSADDDLRSHKVIIVDDGVSSAGTFLACVGLVEDAGGQVVHLVAMIDHSKKKRMAEYQAYESMTHACFTLAE
jgi:adenine phosphoribosyltransferase